MPSNLADAIFQLNLSAGRYSDRRSLQAHSAQVYSQNGEDGMVAEIFRRIGVRDRYFVEIGVQDGLENNTRFLLETGWRGVWIDADQVSIDRARETFSTYVETGALSIVCAMVSTENIEGLLDGANAPATFDFLSVDVDQNTSHIWRAMRRRSRVACIEYNASIPAALAIETAYDAQAVWDGTNWFGASLKCIEAIGRSKELSLVGCDLMGVNAFLVSAKETGGKFRKPFSAENHWEPPRYELVGHVGHPPSKVARAWAKPF